MNTKLLIYTFTARKNLTYKLLRKLDLKDTSRLYILGQQGVESLVTHILKNHYQFILGLGDFRKDARRIRIEAKFINKYGKSKILEIGPKYYYATGKLPLSENLYLSSKASNGPCNRSAYLLADTIATHKLQTKLAFVHIPSSFKIHKAEKVITRWFNT